MGGRRLLILDNLNTLAYCFDPLRLFILAILELLQICRDHVSQYENQTTDTTSALLKMKHIDTVSYLSMCLPPPLILNPSIIN